MVMCIFVSIILTCSISAMVYKVHAYITFRSCFKYPLCLYVRFVFSFYRWKMIDTSLGSSKVKYLFLSAFCHWIDVFETLYDRYTKSACLILEYSVIIKTTSVWVLNRCPPILVSQKHRTFDTATRPSDTS